MVDPKSPKSKDAAKPKVPHVFEDPRAEQIAKTYADAFLNAAEATNVANPQEEFASFLNDVLDRNPDFAAVLSSGMIGRDKKVELIDRTVAKLGSPLFSNFLRVLAQHDRLDLLRLIFKEVQFEAESRAGRGRVQVATALPLSDKALEDIRQRLAASLPFQPILEPRTDPSLLGGIVIRVGDTVYDSSLRARLKDLRTRVRERSLHEIQSGRDRFSHPTGD